MLRLSLLVLLILFFGNAVSAQVSHSSNPLADLTEGYIQANVPAAPNFNKFLTRDLTAYFTKSMDRKVAVKYEPLRDGPTQTGISFPNYYFWVKVMRGGRQIGDGAVRVSAEEKKQFEITDYLTRASMVRNPGQIYQVFPKPVGDKIKKQYLKHETH